MFAFLFSEAMTPFYQNIASFPTVVYTFVLGICVLYWLIAVIGLIDIEFLDFGGDDIGLDGDAIGSTNVLAGLLLKFKLTGVPVTVILTVLSLVGWLVCYYMVHFASAHVPEGWYRYLAGASILVTSFYIAMLITSILIKPLRPLFARTRQNVMKHIIGQTATVRTSTVDNEFGEAFLDDGGAGLILKIRTTGEQTFKKGDRVVLLERLNDDNVFRVISEREFSS